MGVVPFTSAHVPAAAELVVERAAAARAALPLAGSRLLDRAVVADRLAGLADGGLGVAVVEGGEFGGFLAASSFDLWDLPAAYVPEWGHAISPEMVTVLYREAACYWAAEGIRLHVVGLWADRTDLEWVWHGLGFGRVVIDAARGVEPLGVEATGVRRAVAADAATLADMERRLWEHLDAPPVHRIHPGPAVVTELELRLADGDRPMWIAERDGGVVGYLSLQARADVPDGMSGVDAVQCDGAFVADDRRRSGAGAALVEVGIGWARERGFGRVVLDWETANGEADRFWPATGFVPVLVWLARRVA